MTKKTIAKVEETIYRIGGIFANSAANREFTAEICKEIKKKKKQ